MTTAMHRIETREIGPLGLRASIVPDSFNEEARTVDLVWTTGARVERGFFDRFLEELSLDPKHVRMGRLTNGAPLLDAHDGQSNSGVIGVVESASLAPAEGRATVRFAKEDERAESIFRKVRDKIIRNVSVGYRVHKLERVEEEDGALPVMRATDWEPYEISMVPMGADAGAGVRSQPTTNICEFINPLAEEQRTMAPKTPTAAPSAPAATQVSDDTHKAEIKAAEERSAEVECERITSIGRCAKTLGLDDDFANKHIKAKTTADAFRAVAQDAYAERKESHVDVTARPSISPGDDERDKWARGASDAIIARAGVSARVAKDEKRRGIEHKIDPGEFRGLTMMDLARRSLELGGVDTRGMRPLDLVGKAMTHRTATTSDFPVLLENTLHRVLLAAWGITEDTWSRFCARGSVSDFRAHNRLRQGTFSSLDTVLEGAEFTTKAVPDARKESLTATTKGNLVSITRQAIINDDLDAFDKTAMQLGRAAKLTIEKDVYALLALNSNLGPDMADGNPMFDSSSHANVGAGATLSVASIDANRVIMKAQTDESSNDILDIVPQILLVAAGLGGAARTLNAAEHDPDTSGSLRPNSVRGLFSDIIDTGRLTGNRRYIFADPLTAPVIEVAFLNGVEEPFMEMRQGWEVDRTEWKVRLDYAVGGIGFKGALTDAGQ